LNKKWPVIDKKRFLETSDKELYKTMFLENENKEIETEMEKQI